MKRKPRKKGKPPEPGIDERILKIREGMKLAKGERNVLRTRWSLGVIIGWLSNYVVELLKYRPSDIGDFGETFGRSTAVGLITGALFAGYGIFQIQRGRYIAGRNFYRVLKYAKNNPQEVDNIVRMLEHVGLPKEDIEKVRLAATKPEELHIRGIERGRDIQKKGKEDLVKAVPLGTFASCLQMLSHRYDNPTLLSVFAALGFFGTAYMGGKGALRIINGKYVAGRNFRSLLAFVRSNPEKAETTIQKLEELGLREKDVRRVRQATRS